MGCKVDARRRVQAASVPTTHRRRRARCAQTAARFTVFHRLAGFTCRGERIQHRFRRGNATVGEATGLSSGSMSPALRVDNVDICRKRPSAGQETTGGRIADHEGVQRQIELCPPPQRIVGRVSRRGSRRRRVVVVEIIGRCADRSRRRAQAFRWRAAKSIRPVAVPGEFGPRKAPALKPVLRGPDCRVNVAVRLYQRLSGSRARVGFSGDLRRGCRSNGTGA